MSFLNLEGKYFLISGVANKKSVAYFTAKTLIENGGIPLFSVQSETHKEKVLSLFPKTEIFVCDVENEMSINALASNIDKIGIKISGFLHSIAFANYSEGLKPFHETKVADFLQATNISCFSLVSLSNALKANFTDDASIVTVSISNKRATSYGYMGPIKAALESSVDFLAKSLSTDTKIRVNAVCAGPLKTSASAGIPDYVDNYLYAEKLTLRKEALKTQEVSDTISFLLSNRSSGINASSIVIDAGMAVNYFDQDIVKSTSV